MQGAIDENASIGNQAIAIAKGRNQSLAYNNYSEMITALNGMTKDELKRGQNIYIGTVGVPDLWVYSVETSSVNYSYVNDETIVNSLGTDTTIQVGYYKLAQLETQKADITNLDGTDISIDDTNLALGGTNVQNILELINTKINTEVAKLYERWWWKNYKSVTGTTPIDISDLDYQEIIIQIYAYENYAYICKLEYTVKNDLPTETKSISFSGDYNTSNNYHIYGNISISKTTIKVTNARVGTRGSYSNVTNTATVSVFYR